jgi:signal transduction histidine kinase/ActR/RegA family two-component response regulator
MPHSAKRPLRRYLVVLALAGILPLTLLTGAGLIQLYRQQRDDAQRRAVEITRAVAIAVDLELERSLSALKALAGSATLRRGDLATFQEVMRRSAEGQAYWRNVILADPDGKPLANTRVNAGDPMPPTIEPASLEAAVRTGRPAVGALMKGEKRFAFAIRAPVVEEGRVRYVVSAVVAPEAILQIIQRLAVPDEWTISVFDARGARVARNRNHEIFLGEAASPSLQALMTSGAAEGSGLTRVLEGGEAFTAYSRLAGSGWAVALSIPRERVDLAARRTVEVYGAAVLVSLFIGMLAVLAVARRVNEPIARLRDGAQLMGEGGQPAPVETGIREIDQVGDAMAKAAAQRRAYEDERERFLKIEQDARSEAEEANRAKDRFLAMLAHELRNPLAALSNAASLMRHAGHDPRAAQRAVDVVQRQVSHLARLTDDLLDAARALLGKTRLHVAPTNLAAVAGEVLATLKSTGRSDGHLMRSELRDAWVEGDAVRLDQIATNLVVNALKYTPPGGTISVSTYREGGHAVLSVADTGAGMSKELAARAFDLFVQGERALDRAAGGLGIGLTLVRRLAELHGGTADVKSEGEGRGSEFIVRLPAIAAPAAKEPAEPSRAAGIARRILLVEDNDDARETLKELLELMGHRVEAADNGLAGLDLALGMAHDIAFVDLGLPGIDGYELARRLRATDGGRRLFLVALTGYGAVEDRARAIEAGFDAHATKPVGPERLADLIARSAVNPDQPL